MIARPWRDESGAALGLAVILVVLIGVLAAGLLAVLRSDLEATAQANAGQRALHLADAGAQAVAARRRADADPAHYDADGAGNSDWAHVPPDGGLPGKTLTLNGGTADVTIRYLLPAGTATQRTDGTRPSRSPRAFPTTPTEIFSGRLRGDLRRDAAQGRGYSLREGGRGYARGGPVELAGGLRVDRSLPPRTLELLNPALTFLPWGTVGAGVGWGRGKGRSDKRWGDHDL